PGRVHGRVHRRSGPARKGPRVRAGCQVARAVATRLERITLGLRTTSAAIGPPKKYQLEAQASDSLFPKLDGSLGRNVDSLGWAIHSLALRACIRRGRSRVARD